MLHVTGCLALTRVLLEVRGLRVWYPVGKRSALTILAKDEFLRAVDDISFHVNAGEAFSLVGESGSGKTTTCMAIARLVKITGGSAKFEGKELTSMSKSELRTIRSQIQLIFQDPYESLNPRMTVFQIVAEPIIVNKVRVADLHEAVAKALADVQLTPPEKFLDRFPHELSGGQRQRVAIASAVILQPKLLIADEPVSMLDVSIRGSILDVIESLRHKLGLTCLLVLHDLALARYVSDRIAVMYLGTIVEMGEVRPIIEHPMHPYTKALVSVIPVPDPEAERSKSRQILPGDAQSPIQKPSGCRFHPRCPASVEICKKEEPRLVQTEDGRYVACHLVT
jgi:oligopeptide/dipeptide ABC transporter ATP-binding protein